MKSIALAQMVLVILLSSCTGGVKENGQTSVRVENNEANKRVDIYFGEDLFTSYIYPDNIMKPCLWPVVTSNGTEITRKFPMKNAPGERTDHPHQVGMWLNYGDVSGIDYWGHSEAIPAEHKSHYRTVG